MEEMEMNLDDSDNGLALHHNHSIINDELGSGESFDADDNFNDTIDYIPYSSRPETYIVPILFAIIFVIGILGNGTLIAIFLKHRTMRNVPNMYIVSLAVGDLFVILFCVPFTSTVYTLESWPYGEFVCKFSEFIKDLSIGVSVFTLTALSADRYFAIADPMRKLHGRRATRITCITIAGIWLVSIGFAVPSAVFSYIRPIGDSTDRIFYVCYPFPPETDFPFLPNYPQVMVMFHFLVYYAIPLFFIATFYIIMARHLVLSTRNFQRGESQGQLKQMQGRRKVAKMILSFVVIFALCFFPSHLFLLWFYFYPESENGFNDFWHATRITGFCLSFMNSCINPITLYCVSGTFRKMYNEHLFFCCCKINPRRTPQAAMLLRQGGFACGCSLTGIHQVHGHEQPQPQQAGTGMQVTSIRATNQLQLRNDNGHTLGQHQQHHVKSFRDCDNNSAAINKSGENKNADHFHDNCPVALSPWFRRHSSSAPSKTMLAGEIPLTHTQAINTSTIHRFVDDHSC